MRPHRFLRNEAGTAALELALIAPLFITLVIATVQVGVLALMATNLDAAVMHATRKIRTGAADRPTSSAELNAMICARMVDAPSTCQARLATSVQRVAGFGAGQGLAGAAPAGQFDAGGPEDIVLVRATYRLPLILPMYGASFALSRPTEAVLDARAAFRNEPFA